MTRIFVGNVPVSATNGSLSALFAEFGKVESVTLISDRETGKPRGFGYVEMSDPEAASAIQGLNGREFEGRTLKVIEAEEPAVQGDRKRSGRRY